MDYVLWIYGAAASIAVLTVALLARRYASQFSAPPPALIEPTYREGSPSWIAQQKRLNAVSTAPAGRGAFPPVIAEWPFADGPATDEIAAEVEELERQLARVTAPEVQGSVIVHWEAPPTVVRDEITEPGAEHWGDLLRGMRTEERQIYNLEMVATHEALKAPERALHTELDRAVARVLAELERANAAAERRAQYWESAAAGRAVYDDAPTGVFPVLQYV